MHQVMKPIQLLSKLILPVKMVEAEDVCAFTQAIVLALILTDCPVATRVTSL